MAYEDSHGFSFLRMSNPSKLCHAFRITTRSANWNSEK
jgi:hypothetical protein